MVGVIVALLALAGPVTAKSSVDPTTLNPPPPDFFNATCERTGGPSCATWRTRTSSTSRGIVCGSTELRSRSSPSSASGSTTPTGDLTQRHFRESFDGTFSNPDTDKVATWTQHDTVKHDLAVPGDVTSGTDPHQRPVRAVTGPNGATILTDTGMFLVVEGTGEIAACQSPTTVVDDYFANGNARRCSRRLCDALD